MFRPSQEGAMHFEERRAAVPAIPAAPLYLKHLGARHAQFESSSGTRTPPPPSIIHFGPGDYAKPYDLLGGLPGRDETPRRPTSLSSYFNMPASVKLVPCSMTEQDTLRSIYHGQGLEQVPRRIERVHNIVPPPGLLEDYGFPPPVCTDFRAPAPVPDYRRPPQGLSVPDVPPPPTLPTAAANTLSVGSIGHPHSCAKACRYIKRQGGCNQGANCQDCHLCFWQRKCTQKDLDEAEALGLQARAEDNSDEASNQIKGLKAEHSVGTDGHPTRCGEPCKYARRKTGCHDGARCPNCHICLWQRKPSEKACAETKKPEVPCLMTSVGSVGHPFTCMEPCKYARRLGGCRDGWQCSKCHLCQWTRRSQADDNAAPEPQSQPPSHATVQDLPAGVNFNIPTFTHSDRLNCLYISV